MSQPEQLHKIQVEHNLPVPMRDGTLLSANVYRPITEGKWPVIVTRDGYDPSHPLAVEFGRFFSERGYAYVINNARGSYQSEGAFSSFDDGWGEHRDGYDTIEWAARQSWSNGIVGMFGISYASYTQYLAAPTRPPSLKACVPIFGSCVPVDFAFPSGIYHMQWHRGWTVSHTLEMALRCPHGLNMSAATEDAVAINARLQEAQQEIESWFRRLPLKDFPPLKDIAPWYFEQLSHPAGDPWWDQTNGRKTFGEVDAPMLHIAGWYDGNLRAMIDAFTGLVTQGRTARCRSGQRLVIGPWIHQDTSIPPPPLDFTSEAIIDFNETALRWFDYWLKGESNGVANEPAVRLFLMGENRWLEMEQWPPTGISYTPIYLRQGSGKNGQSLNGGRLTMELPTADEAPDSYAYDPDDPIPGHAASESSGEVLLQEIEGRLLTYSSELLDRSVTIVGDVRALLYASSSAFDTDWFVRLCDVWPDGNSVKVCEGMMKARYRNSLQQEELMEPGQIYQFEIDMTATAQTFLAGHRIRVHVTSSEFPLYDRNLNTGGAFGEETASQVAINTIYHDAERPSHVLLPLKPQDG